MKGKDNKRRVREWTLDVKRQKMNGASLPTKDIDIAEEPRERNMSTEISVLNFHIRPLQQPSSTPILDYRKYTSPAYSSLEGNEEAHAQTRAHTHRCPFRDCRKYSHEPITRNHPQKVLQNAGPSPPSDISRQTHFHTVPYIRLYTQTLVNCAYGHTLHPMAWDCRDKPTLAQNLNDPIEQWVDRLTGSNPDHQHHLAR